MGFVMLTASQVFESVAAEPPGCCVHNRGQAEICDVHHCSVEIGISMVIVRGSVV